MLDSCEFGNAKVDTFKGYLRTSLYFYTVCYCHPAVFAVVNAAVEVLSCNKLDQFHPANFNATLCTLKSWTLFPVQYKILSVVF